MSLEDLSPSQISKLSPTRALDIKASELDAMSAGQRAALNRLDPVLADATANENNGVLSYDGALAVLQDVAHGRMTELKFHGLNSVAAAIDSGAIQTSAYVEQIFDDVVQGNSANAWWTGGGKSRVALGDLTAHSSHTQVDELIGKWFLGTDLPQLDSNYSYQDDSGTPLYGATGTPQIADVNQGGTGDCYFLAALAEIAYQDPLTIENMIQANGNGTYSVEFQVNGNPDYVTVNDDFQHLPSGWRYAGGNTAFDGGAGTLWSELIEKAFVQLNEQQGAGDNTSVNSYNGISGGWGEGLTEITGQSFKTYAISTNSSASSVSNTLTTLQSALSNGEDVIMGTSNAAPPTGSNLVNDHMFSVLAVNAAAGTVTLRNPWGGSGAIFTDAESYLAADNVQFLATTGHSALG